MDIALRGGRFFSSGIVAVALFGCGEEAAPDKGDGTMAAAGAAGAAGVPGVTAEVVAFPGAEGFGKHAIGGRGGSVCHVTTLADAGPGSLRDCVLQPNRTVVFDVSGWITLATDLNVVQSYLTIAGQTAPGQGVGVRGFRFLIDGDDVVARFLRVRRGIGSTTVRNDAMNIGFNANNVIVDHFSIGFGTDETLSMAGDDPTGPRNVTVQWSIIAWGLQRDNHSAGSLLVSNQTSIHHTLWAFNKTRNPRGRSAQTAIEGTGHLDWVNNVTFGWDASDPVGEANGWTLDHHPFILGGSVEGRHLANAVGNYFVAVNGAPYAFVNGVPNFELYFENNLLDNNADGALDASVSDGAMITGTPTLLAERIPGGEIMTDEPAVAYARVAAGVGAMVPARDEVDQLLLAKMAAQTGFLIQSEQDLAAEGIGEAGYGLLPNEVRAPDFDADQDGMADAWEVARGLDAANPSDGALDSDGNGYTELEDYLASLVPTAAWGGPY